MLTNTAHLKQALNFHARPQEIKVLVFLIMLLGKMINYFPSIKPTVLFDFIFLCFYCVVP